MQYKINLKKNCKICANCLPLPLDVKQYTVYTFEKYNFCQLCCETSQIVEKYQVTIRRNPFNGWRHYLNDDTNFRLYRKKN